MTTGPLTADDILGLDVEWLARDADDHVGYFTTAGGGYAPPEFLRDTDAHHAAVAAILAMPASTTPRFAPQLGPNATNEWRLVAERGLFAFDSDDSGGPYHLEAAPENPVRADQLPATVIALLDVLRYVDLHFASRPTISAETLLRPPFAEMRFAYLAWLRDWSLPPDDPKHERVVEFVVIAYTKERAKEWGDELVRRRLAGHGDTELSRSAATVAHGHSDPGVPSVRYGEDGSWDR
jgi:hypothetical protein